MNRLTKIITLISSFGLMLFFILFSGGYSDDTIFKVLQSSSNGGALLKKKDTNIFFHSSKVIILKEPYDQKKIRNSAYDSTFSLMDTAPKPKLNEPPPAFIGSSKSGIIMRTYPPNYKPFTIDSKQFIKTSDTISSK
jgi:hypothetical protein